MGLVKTLLKLTLGFKFKPNIEVWTWVHREDVPEMSYRVVVFFYRDEKHRPAIRQQLKEDIIETLDEYEKQKNNDINHRRFITALQKRIDGMNAVNVRKAADMLGLSVRRVYELIEAGELEAVYRRNKLWVTLRSISKFLVSKYRGTTDFNAPQEVLSELKRSLRR